MVIDENTGELTHLMIRVQGEWEDYDGTPVSDVCILSNMQDAINKEWFEYAARCRKELLRRGLRPSDIDNYLE